MGAYTTVRSDAGQPALALVDTTSEQQYVAAPYNEVPTVFLPSPGDLERLVIALCDLTETRPPPSESRHLVVRSLTPVLRAAPASRVYAVLERIAGLRAGSGISAIGLDYTAHDEKTIAELTKRVDGVLWVTEHADGRLGFDFENAPSSLSSRGDQSKQ